MASFREERQMAVLLTGGAGFVGVNIVEALLGGGRDVVLLDAEPLPAAAQAEFAHFGGRLRCVQGSVLDAALLERVTKDMAVDEVIHGAAVTAGVERERTDPAKIAEINLLGTIRVLSAARQAGVQRIVVISTGSVYGETGGLAEGALDEAVHLPVPNNIYGITKYAAERTSLRLAELWGLDLRVGRPAVVFGPWERETGYRDAMSLVLQVTRAAEAGAAIVLPPKGPEDWIYAPDLAAGIVALLDAANPPRRVYNLGTGRTWALAAWCERLRVEYPDFSYRVADDAAQATLRILSRSSIRAPFAGRAARDELGFSPRYDLPAAFDHYLAWRRAHKAIA
jgi:dTDP-glucose 4,6-dehydratase